MIHSYFKENQSDFLTIIHKLAPEIGDLFDSHQFIGLFIKYQETTYIKFLNDKISKEADAVSNVNAEISNALRVNADNLGIENLGKVNSRNIYCLESPCALWRRLR